MALDEPDGDGCFFSDLKVFDKKRIKPVNIFE